MQQANEEVEAQFQLQQQIAQLEAFVKSRMTKEAAERYGNVKTAYPEIAVQALALAVQMIQYNKITTIDDNKFKEILLRVNPPRQKTKIVRK